MPELWIPGTAGPLDELVKRIERRIEGFRTEHGLERAGVSVELTDGSLHRLASISPEPGFGFITLCPHCDQGEPEGGRALLELAPTPSWRSLQFRR